MNAQGYPVTLTYGAYGQAGYTKDHPHRGRDYGCPTGTPVVVGGRQIGLSGATGKVTGPHLHVQEWSTDYALTREPNNAFKGGTVVNVDPNGTQGDGSFGKFITIQTPDGWHDSYCHLSEIDVQIGQIIGEIMTKAEAYTVTDGFYRWGTGSPPTPEQSEYWADRLANVPSGLNELYQAMKKTAVQTDFVPYTGPQLFIKGKEK